MKWKRGLHWDYVAYLRLAGKEGANKEMESSTRVQVMGVAIVKSCTVATLNPKPKQLNLKPVEDSNHEAPNIKPCALKPQDRSPKALNLRFRVQGLGP